VIRNTLFILTVAALVGACASAQVEPHPTAHIDFHPVYADTSYKSAASGTVFNPAGSFDLFMDLRARAVGDILTIALVEKTNAQKEQSTSTAKKSKTDTGVPIIAGGPITYNGKQILSNSIAGDRAFDGKADSSQSNSLIGNITVSVAERLPNGNLLVRGEKLININQGEEYIRLQGIIRPVDIGPDNAVASTKVADAKISYSARGALADSNKQGWLSRFFNSPIFPF
jgi:flagellar L-ring protein precursor FlgH